MKQEYETLFTERLAVDVPPLMQASVKLKARKGNTEWKEENTDLGTMDIGLDESSEAKKSGFWD